MHNTSAKLELREEDVARLEERNRFLGSGLPMTGDCPAGGEGGAPEDLS